MKLFFKTTLLTGFLFILSINLAHGQNGNVKIHKDSRVENLIRQEGTPNTPGTPVQMNGYRVQIFFDSNKDLVDQARNKFISLHSKIDTYVTYNAPNYFLKVGDFRTYNEAEKIKSSIDSNFNTAFIVQEKINLPRID